MIYKNNKTINEWYFNDAELIKVYKNGAICYYKIVQGATPSQEPCFAVVDNIQSYSDTEFVDVYDKATDKWYKLNNLDQYEEYGVYGSGRTITYYEGKLTIDNGYEYEWDGSEWSNIGEVSGSSRVPQGYTEAEYITSETDSSSQTGGCINTGVYLYSSSSNSYQIAGRIKTFFTNGWGDNQTFINIENKISPYNGMVWRYNASGGYKFDTTPSGNAVLNNTVEADGTSAFTITSEATSASQETPLGLFASWQSSMTPYRFCKMRVYSMEITLNGTLVRNFVPATRNSDSKAGLYDVVNDVFYMSVNNFNFTAVGGGGSIVYPKYYTEKDEPENNVVFTDMAEALAYQCPWVGMDVTIDNTPYLFGDAYEWLTKYGLFEVSGEYICYSGDKYEKMEEMVRNVDGTWSSQIPAVYEKGDLIEAGSSDCSSRLPDGYTEVEYIENTSSAYINTGFKPNQDTRITCEMQCVTSTNSVLHFGTGGWDKVNGMWLTYETGVNGTLHISWLGKTVWSTYSSVHGDYNRHTYDWNKNNIYKDGVLVASNTYANYSCPDNLAIFTTILNGTSYETSLKMLGRVYWFKIYDNGTLVRDLVPCVRDSDNIAGAYDLVNDTFYGSGNSNRFVAGNPV